ncbi:glycosyltransferase [Abyssisolibacter fermentans]|uniref:glycosyltransferase n=1 Tax=Abyssisolibacter fermentans TaxID=1766203 RepID=UPI00082C8549
MNMKNHIITNPVNKTIPNRKKFKYKYTNPKTKKKIKLPFITVYTCTHMQKYMNNIFENYNRQIYKNKELIIILKNNKLDEAVWNKKASSYENVKIYKLDETLTLGKCFSFGIKKSNYPYISIFDHDDYYGSNYLADSIKIINNNNVSMIGKFTHFVYFEESKILGLRNPNFENRYVKKYITGGSIIFKKNILEKYNIKYEYNNNVDCAISSGLIKNGLKIYSVDRFNYVYLRRKDKNNHAWKIDDRELLKDCKIIDTGKSLHEIIKSNKIFKHS